jgi:hypothetical protein
MAKKNLILAAVFVMAVLPLYAAQHSAAPVTQTAVPVTRTAAAVTQTAEDETVDVKLKEICVNISPEFQLVLPDTSLKLGFKQKLGDTLLDASTEYNYLYNQIRYDLKYSVDLYFTFSLLLYDAINFEQLYQNSKYIQRNKDYGASIMTPRFFNFITLRQELRSDNYYFARLDNQFAPSTGNTLVGDTWIEFTPPPASDWILAVPGNRVAVNFDRAIPTDFSTYNYLYLNLFADFSFKFDSGSELAIKYEGGYLLEPYNVPLWQVYRLGGYENMMGYNYDEFEGNFKFFARVKYDFPLLENINYEFFIVRLEAVRMFCAAAAGNAGDGHSIEMLDHYSYSAGVGFVVECTFRKRTAFKMTFAVAQAIKNGRAPVFYFVHEF